MPGIKAKADQARISACDSADEEWRSFSVAGTYAPSTTMRTPSKSESSRRLQPASIQRSVAYSTRNGSTTSKRAPWGIAGS